MRSILISNLNNLGDVICSTAALDLIRRNFPGARIGLIVKPDAEGVMRGHPLVDDLYVYRYRSGGGLGTLWSMARAVRPAGYEVFLSLDRKARSALVAFLAGIGARVTPDTLHLTTTPRWWMPFLCNRVIRYPRNSFKSLVEMFEDPVRKTLGIEGRGRTSLPPLGEAERSRAAGLLAPAGSRLKIGFSVRANAMTKTWPADRFAALMDKLAAGRNAFMYVTGAPGDREYIDNLLALCRTAEGDRPINLAGSVSLMETAALASSSDLFITLDTGTVHVVGNSGLEKIICIFTSTIPEGVLESARGARVFWTGEKCCPCLSCPHEWERAPCRTGIGVDEVYEAATAMLDGK